MDIEAIKAKYLVDARRSKNKDIRKFKHVDYYGTFRISFRGRSKIVHVGDGFDDPKIAPTPKYAKEVLLKRIHLIAGYNEYERGWVIGYETHTDGCEYLYKYEQIPGLTKNDKAKVLAELKKSLTMIGVHCKARTKDWTYGQNVVPAGTYDPNSEENLGTVQFF